MTVYDQMNEQTQRAIEETFLLLLGEKEFSKISIRDITEACAINRGTFYLHYVSKYDLLEKIEQKLLDELQKACLALRPEKVLDEARQGELSHFSMQVFHFIDTHAMQFKVLLSSHNQSGFLKRLQNFFAEQFATKYKDHKLTDSDPELPSQYASVFAASAFLGVIEQWLTVDEHESPEQMAEYYVRIILMIQNYS